ncbi:MAG: hypothetical protein P1P85_04265 [Patescibacteria group bacterium]|nr:hypothetical protein [Patescibacteria group bacterium]
MLENDYKKYIKKKIGVDIDKPNEVRYAIEQSYPAFCVLCLPHYFYLKPGKFHHNLINILTDDDIEAMNVIGFRGSAKSTHCSFAYPLWCAITSKYHFIILINDTGTQRDLNMLNIKSEVEENYQIKRCYPSLYGKTGKWTQGQLLFSNDCFILGRSRGQKIRGLKYKQYRPEMVIGDDLEDLEWVKKKENRDKTERWFLGEVVPAQEETKAKMIVIGNMLHKDALMARLKKKGIYTTLEFPLIENGEVAWEAKYPNREAIEKQKAKVNKSTWQREYLLKIISEDEQIIKESDIHYYRNEILTETGEDGNSMLDIRESGVGGDFAISEKQTADYTAFVSGLKVERRGTKILIKPNPINRRIDFDETQKTVLKIQDVMPYGTKFYVEDVGYQKAALQNMSKAGISVFPMRPITDKRARLETVSPFIIDGTVLFPEVGCEELIEQLVGFGIEEHDDLCLAGGTKIATICGDKNIEDIKIGDRVITPFGIKKVLMSKQTGIKKVINNLGIMGTPEHQVFSYKNGFDKLDTLVYSKDISILNFKEQILWKYKKILYSEECNISLWEGKKSIISVSKIQIVDGGMLRDCTLRFGNFIIKGKFRKGLKFIIKILILLITTLKILSVYQLVNIKNSIVNIFQRSKLKLQLKILKKLDCLLQSGISLKKEKNGIVNTQRNNGKIRKCIIKFVLFVEETLKHFILIQKLVEKIVDIRIMQKEIQKKSKQSIEKIILKEMPVYNLTIEDDNVYYANGVLVGNCDALVYLILGLMRRKQKTPTSGNPHQI